MTHFEAAVQSRRPNAHRSSLLTFGATCLGALALALASGCTSDTLPQAEVASGTVSATATGNGSTVFVAEASNGGAKSSVQLKRVYWGRLVDIEDITGALCSRDYVVGEDILGGPDYQVRINPVTDRTTIRILRPKLLGDGTLNPAFESIFRSLDTNLILVADKSLDQTVETPPYPIIPRNAALVLVFDDLIAASTINGQNVRVYTGYPPLTPFEARVIPDYGHGNLVNGQFHTTRVIVDSTISEAEASGDLSGVLTINALGFPASVETTQPNLSIRIPSLVDQSLLQFGRLQNLGGNPVSVADSGSTAQPIGSLSSASETDVVRAMRSGGPTSVTQDINNGYLADPFPPSILGAQAATLSNVLPTATAGVYTATVAFATPACASELRVGDVVEQSSVFAEVICQPNSTCSSGVATGLPVGGAISNVYMRVVEPVNGGFIANGQAKLSVRYSPTIHIGRQACFVRFSSISTLPSDNVGTDTSITIAFSEPMDPTSLSAFDTYTIMGPFSGTTAAAQEPGANGAPPTAFPRPDQLVVGRVQASGDLREFNFTPSKNLRHLNATAERYYLGVGRDLSATPDGTDDRLPTDLSGNAIADDLPPVRFNIAQTQAQVLSKGFVLRFESLDEVGNDMFQVGTTQPYLGALDNPEWRGQYLIDPDRGVFKPRPIQHFPVIQDRIWPVTSLHQPFAGGVQTPMSKLGSHLQTIWRYCDVGFSLLDESTMNLDIEGMAWAPAGGSVQPDNFQRFRILLSHSNRLPDESLDPNLLPLFPNSGLSASYAQNVLDPILDAPREVHPGANGVAGYNVAPIKVFQTNYGRFMMPWPLNEDIPVAQYSYYMWRDTAIQAKGALPDSPGAELNIVNTVNAPAPAAPRTDPTNNARSIALPILMEFRCYPDDEATGVNAFDISLATASSARPNWRAFSTGGYNTSNQAVIRDPDNDPVALGGFNPNSTPTPGAATLNSDNSLYIGQLDVVTRISRMYSHWFDTTITGTTIRYDEPILEPAATQQPTGTRVDLAYRGATQVVTAAHRTNASDLDQYGDRRPDATTNPGTPPVFLNNDRTWKSSLAVLSNNPATSAPGARYFQVRVTFTSNNETSLSPEISSLGFAWQE